LSTRKIPHSTSTAHQLATASISVLANTTIQQLEERNLSRMRTYFMNQNGMVMIVTLIVIVHNQAITLMMTTVVVATEEMRFEWDQKLIMVRAMLLLRL